MRAFEAGARSAWYATQNLFFVDDTGFDSAM